MRVGSVLLFVVACVTFGGHHAGSIDRALGHPCSKDSDCDDTCLLDVQFPGGFCSRHCNSDDDCTGDAVCAGVDGGTCLFKCPAFDCSRLVGPYSCRDQSHVVGPQTFDGTVQVCIGPPPP